MYLQRPVSIKDKTGTKRLGRLSDFGDLLNLINGIENNLDGWRKQQKAKGAAVSLPTKAAFKAELDSKVRNGVENAKRKLRKKPLKITAALIKTLRSPTFLADFDQANAVDRLMLVQSISLALPFIDMFDPAMVDGDNGKPKTQQRFSADVAKKRPSVFSPTRVKKLADDLAIELTPNGFALQSSNAAALKAQEKSATIFAGTTKPDNRVKFVVKVYLSTMSVMSMMAGTAEAKLEADAAARALFTKLLPKFDNSFQAAFGANAKIEKIQETVDTFGPKSLSFKNALQGIGTGIGFYSSLTKIYTGLRQFVEGGSYVEGLTTVLQSVEFTASVIGQYASVTAKHAFATSSRRASLKLLAGVSSKVVTLLAIPLLVMDAVAMVKKVDSAVRARDYSVAMGEALAVTSGAIGAITGLYLKFAAGASVTGPVGFAIALGIGLALVATYLILFTRDDAFETFAKTCAFAKSPSDSSDPTHPAFRFGGAKGPNLPWQITSLRSLVNSTGFKVTRSPLGISLHQGHAQNKTKTKIPSNAIYRLRYLGKYVESGFLNLTRPQDLLKTPLSIYKLDDKLRNTGGDIITSVDLTLDDITKRDLAKRIPNDWIGGILEFTISVPGQTPPMIRGLASIP